MKLTIPSEFLYPTEYSITAQGRNANALFKNEDELTLAVIIRADLNDSPQEMIVQSILDQALEFSKAQNMAYGDEVEIINLNFNELEQKTGLSNMIHMLKDNWGIDLIPESQEKLAGAWGDPDCMDSIVIMNAPLWKVSARELMKGGESGVPIFHNALTNSGVDIFASVWAINVISLEYGMFEFLLFEESSLAKNMIPVIAWEAALNSPLSGHLPGISYPAPILLTDEQPWANAFRDAIDLCTPN